MALIAGLGSVSFAQANSALIQKVERGNRDSQVQRLKVIMKRSLAFDQMKLIEEGCVGRPRVDIHVGGVDFRCLSSTLGGYNDEYISAGSFTGSIRMITTAVNGRFVFRLSDRKVLNTQLQGRVSLADFRELLDAAIVKDDTLREALGDAYQEEKIEREMKRMGDGLNRQ